MLLIKTGYLSFNAADYIALHLSIWKIGVDMGIVVAKQIPSETVRRLLHLTDHVSADEIRNQLCWLPRVEQINRRSPFPISKPLYLESWTGLTQLYSLYTVAAITATVLHS